MGEVLQVDDDGRVRTLTLNRPEVRNALSRELLERLAAALRVAEADAVGAVVLTGAGKAFCAGLDLAEVAAGGLDPAFVDDPELSPWMVLHDLGVPVIGAINGPAITGGLELALHCSFLVASERAVFGDTHARVGLHPGGGLTVLLPAAVGLRQAREMSFTGSFLSAEDAYRVGLVNRLVDSEDLLPTAMRLAGEIAGNDQRTVAAMLDTYRRTSELTGSEGLALERERFRSHGIDPSEVGRRKGTVIGGGRARARQSD